VEGKWGIAYTTLTYNTMINCYSKSRRPDAGEKASMLFEEMKSNAGKPGWELCSPDIYTYCSLIDTISKNGSYETSQRAISLMVEVERSYELTGDRRLQPNIQLYTSVLKAIGRSHKDPHRAQTIADRLESSCLYGPVPRASIPDVLFYNSLINAYGWSDMEGRSQKCFEVLQHMVDLSESGKLPAAKPDTVTINSVLNACANEKPSAQNSSEDIMKIVVKTFEMLKQHPSSKSGGFGRPDQNSYAQVMAAIANHITDDDEKRISMAEATFLQCSEDGLVGNHIVTKLSTALPYQRFQILMGKALDQDGTKEKPNVDFSKLPRAWTVNVPVWQQGRKGPVSRSRRRPTGYQVTKQSVRRQ